MSLTYKLFKTLCTKYVFKIKIINCKIICKLYFRNVILYFNFFSLLPSHNFYYIKLNMRNVFLRNIGHFYVFLLLIAHRYLIQYFN